MTTDPAFDPRFVQARLAALRAADPHFKQFGAQQHRYTLGPPLQDVQVQAFEQQHDLRLPEDYRTFLLTVGNGGAGPSYGMRPLQDLGWKGLLLPFTPPTTSTAFEEEENCEDGVLLLCDHGCEQYSSLVVRGGEVGRMYLLTDGWMPETPRWGELLRAHEWNWPGATEALFSEYDQLPRQTFIQWYREWLDQALVALTR